MTENNSTRFTFENRSDGTANLQLRAPTELFNGLAHSPSDVANLKRIADVIDYRDIGGGETALTVCSAALVKHNNCSRALARENDVQMTLLDTLLKLYRSNPNNLAMGRGDTTSIGGRYVMSIDIALPGDPSGDAGATKNATVQMRRVAASMGIPAGSELEEHYAHINHGGITVTVSPQLGVSLETDGSQFRRSHDVAHLTQHNLYNGSQGLRCLVGAVALDLALHSADRNIPQYSEPTSTQQYLW
ncbi:MAG: hypothetical protein ABI303_04400 [Candidatus Saccharimonas sp.]